jgi:F5/8 type C domain
MVTEFSGGTVPERGSTMRLAPGWIIPLGLVIVLAAGAAGAADRCGNADLSALTSRIYVSPAGTDSDSCGTSSSTSCQSIQRGIDRCGGAGCGVLVRYGLYTLPEAIRLKDAVNVYGRCVFDNGADHKYRSVIEAPPDGKPAITAASINSPTLLDGVFVKGSDATSPGGASVAMTVSDSGALTITNSTLSSGKGADGAPGQTFSGNSGGGGAQPGWQQAGPGGGGGPACPSSGSPLPGRGGDGGPGTWNRGEGCFLECDCKNNNDPTGQTGQDSGDVKGAGGGGGGHPGPSCSGSGHESVGDGGQGSPGNPGSCSAVGGATTADIWGAFTGTDWHPGRGGSGVPGSTGSGGGGGGGGGACTYYTEGGGWRDDNGLPAGGGGGGGCGGPGGQGGQQGGASIVIVLFKSAATIMGDVLVPGPGGQGGAGAIGSQGGPGGSGASGAQGRNGFRGCPGSGGPGGVGGQGGAGGGGAGGNGGPSVGTAFVSSDYKFSRFIYDVQPGPRGLGGAGGKNAPDQCQAAKGSDGVNGGGGKWNHWLYVTASASSSYPGAPPANAVDGDPNTVWNSGGGPPAWIELDLNQTVTLVKVHLLVEQSPAGQTTQQLYFGPSPAPTALIATLSGNTKDMQWLEVDAPNNLSSTGNSWPTGRYLRVQTTASPSWVAWREIVVQTK